jgi:hypothetical protein
MHDLFTLQNIAYGIGAGILAAMGGAFARGLWRATHVVWDIFEEQVSNHTELRDLRRDMASLAVTVGRIERRQLRIERRLRNGHTGNDDG